MPGNWKKLDLLSAALPVAIVVDWLHAPAPVVFVTGAAAVIPLAGLTGRATESLAHRVGGAIGALLNATFGNVAELAIAALLVIHGHVAIVKASVVGSLVGNLLLLLGVSIIVSSYDQVQVAFNRASRVQATMLFLTVGIFLLPSLFAARAEGTRPRVSEVSDAVAVLLVTVYGLALVFMMVTHRSVFRGGVESGEPPPDVDATQSASREPDAEAPAEQLGWAPKKAVTVLAVATLLVAIAAEIVSGSVEQAGTSLGLGAGFLGFIVLPLVGNASEQFSALALAARDRLDVAADIAVGASIQLVMLVVPVLVLVGTLAGHAFTLDFQVIELAVLVISTLLVRQMVDDRKANWFEGVMLLAFYTAFGISAYFIQI